jgi:hypothetical protein
MEAPVLVALFLGCASPEERAAAEYVAALEPLLDENALVAERLGLAAAAVFRGESHGTAVRVAWQSELVPLAAHLQDQAKLLVVPPDWTDTHRALVEVWGARADAYRDLANAVNEGDDALWSTANARAHAAKVDEERWFISTNVRLQPYQLTATQFPARHPAARATAE